MSRQQKVKLGKGRDRADHRTNVAIKYDVAGRPFFFGRERNKRSRKARHKFFSPKPIDLSSANAIKPQPEVS